MVGDTRPGDLVVTPWRRTVRYELGFAARWLGLVRLRVYCVKDRKGAVSDRESNSGSTKASREGG